MTFYLIFEKKYKNISLREYIVFLVVILIPLLPWIFFRYQYDGLQFFQTMISYDLVRAGTVGVDGPRRGNFFHFLYLLKRSIPWAVVLFVIPFYRISYDFRKGMKKAQELDELYKEKLLLFAAIVPFLITFAYQTKHPWYINPAYPPFAIIVSWYLWDMIKASALKEKKRIITFIAIFIFLSFVIAEYLTVKDFIIVKTTDKYRKQELLLSLKPETCIKHAVVYDIEKIWPSEIFVAKVLRRIDLTHIPNIDIFVKEKGENLLILKNAPEEAEKIGQYKLNVVASNKDWIIVDK